MTDNHRCELICDGTGEVVYRARVAPNLSYEGRFALGGLIAAAVKHQEDLNATDPEGAAERARRQQAMAERARRWRGEP